MLAIEEFRKPRAIRCKITQDNLNLKFYNAINRSTRTKMVLIPHKLCPTPPSDSRKSTMAPTFFDAFDGEPPPSSFAIDDRQSTMIAN